MLLSSIFLLNILVINICGIHSVQVPSFDSEIIADIQHIYHDVLSPEPLLSFLATEISDQQCADDIKQIQEDIMHMKFYALKMIDSWGKIPDGLLLGNHYFLGQYDECLSVQTNASFNGQYCLLGMSKNGKTPIMGPYTMGLCIPSSCRAIDLNTAFMSNKLLHNLNITIGTVDANCSETQPKMRPGDWVVVALLAIIGLLAVVNTLYDVYQSHRNVPAHPLLTLFSLKKNGKALFSVRKGDSQMNCLSGLRTISMMWVILCHTSLLSLFGPTVNPLDAFGDIKDKDKVIISNGYLSVDTFFFLSGLLVCFVFFRDIGKTGSYDAPRGYLNRYFRLTPPYAMMILLQVTVLNYIGDGPLWTSFSSSQRVNCENHWWTGLIYIQNLVNPNTQCLIQTWYLSADMQFYWIAPIILYPLLLWPIVGAVFLVFLTIASTCWAFAIDYAYKFAPIPMLDTTGKENQMDNYASYNRLAPWLVGILLGVVICGMKARKMNVKLNKWLVLLGWCFSTAVCSACLFGLLTFFDDVTFDPLQSAAFLAFHRLGWALGLAWIVFACINGYGGPINVFLSWSFLEVLGKMSYSAYLVHISVLMFKFGVSRALNFSSHLELVLTWFTIALLSNMCGIILALLVEYPFLNIDRHFFRDIKIFPYPPPKPPKAKSAKAENPPEKSIDNTVGQKNNSIKGLAANESQDFESIDLNKSNETVTSTL